MIIMYCNENLKPKKLTKPRSIKCVPFNKEQYKIYMVIKRRISQVLNSNGWGRVPSGGQTLGHDN